MGARCLTCCPAVYTMLCAVMQCFNHHLLHCLPACPTCMLHALQANEKEIRSAADDLITEVRGRHAI
jgi:hypothetical protein